MYICQLSIKGFRRISEATVIFGPHRFLLGANNLGTSSIIDAFGLALGREPLEALLMACGASL